MKEQLQNSVLLSLWECLHDGTVVSFQSDLMARTVNITVDNTFHWKYNNLAPTTRFYINLADVLCTSALTFIPWPGRSEGLTAVDYERIVEESSKGTLQSVDWDEALKIIKPANEFLISGASFTRSESPSCTLCLQGSVDTTGDYYEIRIEAKHAQFFVGEDELEVEDFVKFGERYWQAFSTRTRPEDLQNEPE